MLEIRYNKTTKELTAWCGDPKQFNVMGCWHYEAIVIIDSPIPDKPMEALLYDEATQSLINNPDYVEPEPPKDLATRVSELEGKVETLENK